MPFTKIYEAQRWASLFLQEHNREQGVVDILLMHHLKMNRAQLMASLRDPFPETVRSEFIADVDKHATTGVPVQHLTGYESFYGREFAVGPDVLVPRPETEELVLGTLDRLSGFSGARQLRVVDVGTGSGIIAITLKKERPDLEVTAIDVSDGALRMAKHNAEELGAEVTFCKSNFLSTLIEKGMKVDVVISNPPYIPETDRETLSQEVRDFDPELALFGGVDGLVAYREIVDQLPQVLAKPALVAFEIGYQQGQSVHNLLITQFPDARVEVVQDINGKDRMVYGWIE